LACLLQEVGQSQDQTLAVAVRFGFGPPQFFLEGGDLPAEVRDTPVAYVEGCVEALHPPALRR
jgi:hypothetical protein